MTRSVKAGLGRTLFTSRLHHLVLRDTALVVLFHRVHTGSDSDAIGIDVELFERYCRFFGRFFRVVPLRDLVNRLARGAPAAPMLAITFDDGYRDNFDNAAPILERFSLPATFFVVSRWIGTDVVPWWDQRDGRRYPWMTWGEVRSLQARGFEIGAHTRTHVDLGAVDGSVAREEIVGGRLDLEDRLGAPVDSFAYPYGGRDKLTNSNRDVVRAAGYYCCCSGFGGLNRTGTDPFRLLRVPLSSWCKSPHQFGFEVAAGLTL
jgi:peptidoglycan/xylan/chitin deacetylase (PgdA/CDA1 family)